MGVAGNKAICKNITVILGYLIKVIVLANLVNLEFILRSKIWIDFDYFWNEGFEALIGC